MEEFNNNPNKDVVRKKWWEFKDKKTPFILVKTKKYLDFPRKVDADGHFIFDDNGNAILETSMPRVEHMKETFEIHDELNFDLVKKATFIMELFSKSVIKNEFEIKDEEVAEHYLQVYGSKIVEAIEAHMRNEAIRKGSLEQAIIDVEQTMGIATGEQINSSGCRSNAS